MSLFLKLLRGSQNRATHQKTQRLQHEAVRKKEDPVTYLVKQKLKHHPDPKYSKMTDEQMTREATFLTDEEALQEFFSDLLHTKGVQLGLGEEEEEEEASKSDTLTQEVRQKQLERVGQLTLKLHLSHLDESPPSYFTRLGAALLKIPYGVLHASLEIGDTSNPSISYMVEFNDSSLVQPRKKSRLEASSLEATIHLGGSRLNTRLPRPSPAAEMRLREKRGKVKKALKEVDSTIRVTFTPPLRPRSICVSSEYKYQRIRRASSVPTSEGNDRASTEPAPATESLLIPQSLPHTQHIPTSTAKTGTNTGSSRSKCVTEEAPLLATSDYASSNASTAGPQSSSSLLSVCTQPLIEAPQTQPITTAADDTVTAHGEDLTQFVQLSLSKILIIEKLAKIIAKYNRCYYYHNITRNCQTFIIEVLQSLGVWENFKLGERLELYLNNLSKGKKEVYKCHKSLNDRVRYLVSSGEIEETTYDELRYLRSLYTIFHIEELTSASSARPTTAICYERDCMLKVLEEHLFRKRPEGATRLLPPDNYI